MRLIDADGLKERLKEYCVDGDKDIEKYYEIMGIDDCVDNAPTIDAVSREKYEASEEARHILVEFADELLARLKERVEVVRKPIQGYEGYYEVDQFGRVFSLDRIVFVEDHGRKYNKLLKGSQLKQHMHTAGYKTVCLTKDGKSKTQYVHRLVAEAFIPNPEDLPFINHKDGDKTNNFAENLEWCTAQYNNTYGKAREKRAKKIRGKALSEEHKKKISESLKRYFSGERKDED